MNYFTFIGILFFPFFGWVQVNYLDDYLEQERRSTEYKGDRNFTLQNRWYLREPNPIDDNSYIYYDDFDETEDIIKEKYINVIDKNSLSEEDIILRRLEKDKKTKNIVVKKLEPIKWPKITLPEPKFETIDIDDSSKKINYYDIFKRIARYVFPILVSLILGFVIYKIINKLKINTTTIAENSDQEWNPNKIKKSDMELKLEHAKQNENYREAIRIHYLYLLKELIRQQLIDWQPEKTNHDYLHELRLYEHKTNFSECVRIFELVWYGEHIISKEYYYKLSKVFENYINKLLHSYSTIERI